LHKSKAGYQTQQPNIKNKLHKSLSQIINYEASSGMIELIVQEVEKKEYKQEDANMIQKLIEEIIPTEELIKFINDYEAYLKLNIYTGNIKFLESNNISIEPNFIIGHTAKRIYKIRNALVHFSDNDDGKEKYVPTAINEKMLAREVPLLQFLAEKAIKRISSIQI
jgi:hypothetical protein